MSNSKGKKPQHSQTRSSLSLRGITTIPQSFLIWWSGADNKMLPSHARKGYAGLGAMAMVSTVLAAFGGYTFVLYSLGSHPGAIFGAILAGCFMWGMDRSILGFSSEQKKRKKQKKEGNLVETVETFDATFWVKILINVAFSTVLTVPLSTAVLIKAVDNVKANDTANEITAIEAKITTQDQRVSDARKALKDVRKAKYIKRNGVVVLNDRFDEKEKEESSKLDIEEEELRKLREKRDNLNSESDKYKRGENITNLPDQFNIVMTRARWTDSVLGWLFFPITAIMGSGAVLIRTLVFNNDANSKIVQRLEKEAKDQEDLQYMMNTSANHVYSSIFNNDEMQGYFIFRKDGKW